MLTHIPHLSQRRQVHSEPRDQGICGDWPPHYCPAKGGEIPKSGVEAPWVQKGKSQATPPPLYTVEALRWPPGLCLQNPSPTCDRQASTDLSCTLTAEGAAEGVRTLQQTRGRNCEKSLTPDLEVKSRLTYSSSNSQTEKPRPSDCGKYWPKVRGPAAWLDSGILTPFLPPVLDK